MRKINLLYLAVIPLCLVLFRMQMAAGNKAAFFYGFAENKETELSHDRPVRIDRIHVTAGEVVTKGQLLIQVTQAEVVQKINEKGFDLERLELLAAEKKMAIRREIQQLVVKKQTQTAEVENQIRELTASIQQNQQLREGLSSISDLGEQGTTSVNDVKLAALQAEVKLVAQPIDLEIAQLEATLKEVENPVRASRKKLQSELDYYANEKNALSILAPADGVIGSVMCKEGEYIDAFSPFINFYEPNPTIAKGYVHESLIPEVKIGDELWVSSSLHPDHHIVGTVTGLGTRIVEIPERLRKIPDFKTYGREVLIRIPGNNNFLQKERVLLNTHPDSMSNSGWRSVLGL